MFEDGWNRSGRRERGYEVARSYFLIVYALAKFHCSRRWSWPKDDEGGFHRAAGTPPHSPREIVRRMCRQARRG
jgi:hypothetical protein